MKIRMAATIALLLTLNGCATSGDLNATAPVNTRGLELYEQGQFPEASAMFKRCVEIQQNPACIHNIGMMVETSKYNDPDPKVREAMWKDGYTPIGRASQYYTLAARYGQQESIDALKRLNRAVPPADLVNTVHHSDLSASQGNGTANAGMWHLLGCLLVGGDSSICLPNSLAYATGQPQPQLQPERQARSRQQSETSHSALSTGGAASNTPAPFQGESARAPVPSLSGCTHNTNCTWPETCVKPPGGRTGTCAVEVNRFGTPTHQRTGQGMGCRYDSECGVGFSCNRPAVATQLGVCVKN